MLEDGSPVNVFETSSPQPLPSNKCAECTKMWKGSGVLEALGDINWETMSIDNVVSHVA